MKRKRVGTFRLGVGDGSEMIGVVLTHFKRCLTHHASRHRAVWVRFWTNGNITVRLAARWHEKDQWEMSVQDAKDLRRLLDKAIKVAEEIADPQVRGRVLPQRGTVKHFCQVTQHNHQLILCRSCDRAYCRLCGRSWIRYASPYYGWNWTDDDSCTEIHSCEEHEDLSKHLTEYYNQLAQDERDFQEAVASGDPAALRTQELLDELCPICEGEGDIIHPEGHEPSHEPCRYCSQGRTDD